MEVAESKGILFVTLAVAQDEESILTTLSEQELIQKAREKVIEFISTCLIEEMIVGLDGKKVQVAVKL
jgi:hypothetical protein